MGQERSSFRALGCVVVLTIPLHACNVGLRGAPGRRAAEAGGGGAGAAEWAGLRPQRGAALHHVSGPARPRRWCAIHSDGRLHLQTSFLVVLQGRLMTDNQPPPQRNAKIQRRTPACAPPWRPSASSRSSPRSTRSSARSGSSSSNRSRDPNRPRGSRPPRRWSVPRRRRRKLRGRGRVNRRKESGRRGRSGRRRSSRTSARIWMAAQRRTTTRRRWTTTSSSSPWPSCTTGGSIDLMRSPDAFAVCDSSRQRHEANSRPCPCPHSLHTVACVLGRIPTLAALGTYVCIPYRLLEQAVGHFFT